jgi:hypothetical protein
MSTLSSELVRILGAIHDLEVEWERLLFEVLPPLFQQYSLSKQDIIEAKDGKLHFPQHPTLQTACDTLRRGAKRRSFCLCGVDFTISSMGSRFARPFSLIKSRHRPY